MKLPKITQLCAIAVCGTWCLSTYGAVLEEDFSAAPARWSAYGETNLFHWNQSAGNLEVTWDSKTPVNSYFALPLGTVLSTRDDFTVTFDVRLTSAFAGVNPERPGPFQVSAGFINLAKATLPYPEFIRGTGTDSPDLVEFSYFPDPGGEWKWGPSLTTTMADSTRTNWSWGGFAPLALQTGAVYRVTMAYTASDKKLRTNITRDGAPFTNIDPAYLPEGFTDFQVDAFAVASYTELGQNPEFDGSVLAQGVIDNVKITLPAPPLGMLRGSYSGGVYKVRLQSQLGWRYALQRSATVGNTARWEAVSSPVEGTGGELILEDDAPPANAAFYRVTAQRL